MFASDPPSVDNWNPTSIVSVTMLNLIYLVQRSKKVRDEEIAWYEVLLQSVPAALPSLELDEIKSDSLRENSKVPQHTDHPV